jgi:hypothetical protein
VTIPPTEPGGAYWAHQHLACALTLGATGLTCVQAGVELLIDTEIWLHRADFVSQFITLDANLASARAFIDWQAAITALQQGRLPCSGGERRILLIAASLSGGIPVDLRDALTGLDATNLALTAAAVRHATGSGADLWEDQDL